MKISWAHNLRSEADEHERSARAIWNIQPVPTYEQGLQAETEMRQAIDKRALADRLGV